MPGGDVFSSAIFQVADGEFDHGVLTVEPVGFDGVEVVAVGDEAVMSPLGKQAGLGGVSQAGAAHHQPDDATMLSA